MDLTGEYVITAARDRVWAALNDPDILAKALPGCEELTRTGDLGFEAVATQKIGPVKARFKGKVTLEDLNPPESYTLKGEGTGGAAGFAKGQAKVRLDDVPEGTRLSYEVKANVGGKLAQIGQRLIDQAAKKIADDFFANFSAALSSPAPAAESALAEPEPPLAAAPTAVEAPPPPSFAHAQRSTGMWFAGALLVILAVALAAAFLKV